MKVKIGLAGPVRELEFESLTILGHVIVAGDKVIAKMGVDSGGNLRWELPDGDRVGYIGVEERR